MAQRASPPEGAVPPAAGPPDIREVLRAEHARILGHIERLRRERDATRRLALLGALRRAWMIHALAEESVVYKALEGVRAPAASASHADERFVEHEIVERLFAQLAGGRSATLEWRARLNVAAGMIERHIEAEDAELFGRIEARFDAPERARMGERFLLARGKLTLLEEAKAA